MTRGCITQQNRKTLIMEENEFTKKQETKNGETI